MKIAQMPDIDQRLAPAPQLARFAPRLWPLWWALATMLLTMAIVACGEGDGNGDPGGTSPPPVSTLDAARAVTATLGSAGDSLSTARARSERSATASGPRRIPAQRRLTLSFPHLFARF